MLHSELSFEKVSEDMSLVTCLLNVTRGTDIIYIRHFYTWPHLHTSFIHLIYIRDTSFIYVTRVT